MDPLPPSMPPAFPRSVDSISQWFQSLCTPLKVFIVLSLISLVLSLLTGGGLFGALASLLVALLVYFLIRWLCANGHTTVAWVVVFLPLIMTALMFVFVGSLVGAVFAGFSGGLMGA
jgi:hypothetical protein